MLFEDYNISNCLYFLSEVVIGNEDLQQKKSARTAFE